MPSSMPKSSSLLSSPRRVRRTSDRDLFRSLRVTSKVMIVRAGFNAVHAATPTTIGLLSEMQGTSSAKCCGLQAGMCGLDGEAEPHSPEPQKVDANLMSKLQGPKMVKKHEA